MNNLDSSSEAVSDRATMTARVVADAKRLYRHLADDVALEHCASQAVAEIWTDPIKVTAFVPVLALRQIQETLAPRGGRPTFRQLVEPGAGSVGS